MAPAADTFAIRRARGLLEINMIKAVKKAQSVRVVHPTFGRFDMKILSPSALHEMPPALHISVDRNVQQDSERDLVDEHRRASETHERQRNTGDRKKPYCHAHILDKVESEISCKSGHHVGCRL